MSMCTWARAATTVIVLAAAAGCQTQFCHPGMVEEDGGGMYFRRDADGGGIYFRRDGGGMYHRRDEEKSDGRRQEICRAGAVAPPEKPPGP